MAWKKPAVSALFPAPSYAESVSAIDLMAWKKPALKRLQTFRPKSKGKNA
jgi:hypothetical protein